MAYIYDIADVWAASGTTFTGIKLNVTDTASAAGSLLMDLQVGGVSRFSVRKDGATVIPAGNTYNTSTPNLSFGTSGWGMMATAYGLSIRGANDGYLTIAPNFTISSTSFFGWSSAAGAESIITGADTRLYRDAANTLAQRNGVNAQAFNLYNTYTDASNYERGVFDFTSVANQLTIGTTKAGTGASRLVRFVVGGTRVAISDGAYFQIDKDLYPTENIIMAAKYTEMAEMTAPASPAANKVRIYAEDDGAGKTRLMARFATGAAVQIAIEP